jgi:beta-glucosidase
MPIDPPKEKHDHKTLAFPKDFLWGTATSAYQVEGNNINADWWEWEKKLPKDKRSEKACDQYNLYQKDIDLAKQLNLNAQRLSIEWSRIEPEEGIFNQDAIDHYVDVLKSLKEKDITVMLTLWHFTIPEWLSKKGGWENSNSIVYFERFVQKIYPEINRYVDLWITLNEPGVYAFLGYLDGYWPPQKKSKWAAFKVIWHLAETHKKIYSFLKSQNKNSQIGLAHNIQSFESYHKHSIIEGISVLTSDIFSNHSFYFLTKGYHDFLGINYYFHHRFNKEKGEVIPMLINAEKQARDVSDMGWEVYPEGIFEVLTDFADHIPIYITECGIASTNDDRRIRFLLQYLQEVYRAIQGGVPVKGFFYWSLLDNFEWAEGFDPRFGLVEVDYQDQKRKPRPSAYVYSEIAKQNGIPHHLMRFLGHTVNAKEVLCYKHNSPQAFCEHVNLSSH